MVMSTKRIKAISQITDEDKDILLERVMEMQCAVRQNYHLHRTVNNGGCGFFAKSLNNQLKQNSIDCKIVFMDRTNPKKKKLIKKSKSAEKLSLEERRALSAEHVLVQVGNLLIDATDIYVDVEPNGEYTEKELDYVLSRGYWSMSYDRRKNKTIEKIIKLSFRNCRTRSK